jgi:pimeloyl-ACP methyl ester carboxylesterase
MEQIAAAMDALRHQAGIRRFVPIGLCAGACWGFHAALRDPDVCGAILLNPSLLYWDPSIDRRRMVKLFAGGFNAWTGYGKMILGGLQPGEIRRGARRVVERLRRKRARPGLHLELGFDSVAQAWSALERAGKRVTLVFREGEALLSELEASGQLPPRQSALLRCIRVPNGGHTFRPLWAQELVHGILDGEIAALASAARRVPATA